MKEYAVTLTIAEQMTHDEWLPRHRVLKANDTTTMAEIASWCKAITGAHMLTQVEIVEMETPFVPQTEYVPTEADKDLPF